MSIQEAKSLAVKIELFLESADKRSSLAKKMKKQLSDLNHFIFVKENPELAKGQAKAISDYLNNTHVF